MIRTPAICQAEPRTGPGESQGHCGPRRGSSHEQCVAYQLYTPALVGLGPSQRESFRSAFIASIVFSFVVRVERAQSATEIELKPFPPTCPSACPASMEPVISTLLLPSTQTAVFQFGDQSGGQRTACGPSVGAHYVPRTAKKRLGGGLCLPRDATPCKQIGLVTREGRWFSGSSTGDFAFHKHTRQSRVHKNNCLASMGLANSCARKMEPWRKPAFEAPACGRLSSAICHSAPTATPAPKCPGSIATLRYTPWF